MELLEKQIFELEKELLKPQTRKSAEKINELLSDDFIEFCSSGKVYHYRKGDVWDDGSNLPDVKWELKEFAIKELSNDCVLATYKIIKHGELNKTKKYSLRSSIWKYSNDTWKMTFHQGTLTIAEFDFEDIDLTKTI